jgi:Ala-tRNA(Pro) deacylase
MGIAITLAEYLTEHESSYEVIEHVRTSSSLEASEVTHIPGDQMVKCVLLGDSDRYLLAVIPATHRLDMDKLGTLSGRKLELISEGEMASAFSDCEVGAMPPLGDAYGIEVWVDPCLVAQPEIYFESGDHCNLIKMAGPEFRDLIQDAVSVPMSYHI